MELKRYNPRLLIDYLRSSLWFTTGLVVLASIALVAIVQLFDNYGDVGQFIAVQWLRDIGPEGARTVLATIAGSTITVAGVIFSTTIVALTMASSQFGPRLLREFIKAGHTQWALGIFIGCFIYSLLTLSRIPASGDLQDVPFLSVLVGILLGFSSFFVLIYYIHNTALMIRAPRMIDSVGQEAIAAIQREFPENQQTDDQIPGSERPEYKTAVDIRSPKPGYIQSIDVEQLLNLACRHDLFISMQIKIGRYMVPGQLAAVVYTNDDCRGAPDSSDINDALILGPERTSAQDAEFTIDQLVEIAVRSLSTGINDPFTAIHCIDQLGAALAVLGCRHAPPSIRCDVNGQPRVQLEVNTHKDIIRTAFNQIRQNAVSHPVVSIHLLETIAVLARLDNVSEFTEELKRQADLVYESCLQGFVNESDRMDFEQRYSETRALFH